MKMLASCFVTGTDTDSGKTVATSAILRHWSKCGLNCAGMKPVASGFEVIDDEYLNRDIEAVRFNSTERLPLELINQYSFHPAIAPHIAAKESGCNIDLNHIRRCFLKIQGQVDRVVVEGAGGWRVPLGWPENNLTECDSIASLAQTLALPVVLVVGMKLGCINHALLTAEAILADGVELLGWVANSIDGEFSRASDNLITLQRLMPAPMLFQIPHLRSQASLNSFVPEM